MPVDATQLKQACLYQAEAPLPAVTADLDQITQVVAKFRSTRKHLMIAAGVFLVAGMVMAYPVPILGGILIAAAIPLFIAGVLYARKMVGNLSRCDTAKSILGIFASEADRKAPVRIKLLFKAPRVLLGETPVPQRKGNQKFFRESWLSIETTLLDGTDITNAIDDLIRVRSYKAPSGKWKTKSRTRHMVSMRFVYPAERYGNLTSLSANIQKDMHLPSGGVLRGVQVDDKQVKVKALVLNSPDLIPTNSMLALGVYQVINLARKMAGAR